MSDTITTLHTARSSLSAVRKLLESLDRPELLLSAKLAEVQVDIGDRLSTLYAEANVAASGPQKVRWDP